MKICRLRRCHAPLSCDMKDGLAREPLMCLPWTWMGMCRTPDTTDPALQKCAPSTRALAEPNDPRHISPQSSEPEQIAQLEEEGVVRPREPPKLEGVLVHHVAAVPGEHHRPRHRLIAEQHIGVEEIAARSGGASQTVWPHDEK